MRAPVGVIVLTTMPSSGQRCADPLDEGHRRRRLAHRDRVDPAARLGRQPVAEPPETLGEVPAVARPAAPGQEGRQVARGARRRAPRSRARTSAARLLVHLPAQTARSAASMSLRAASSPARSAARATWIGSPKRTTQRANGLGIRNSSQERSRHSREAPTADRHDGRAGEPRQRDHAGLEHLARAPRAVGDDDHLVPVAQGAGERAQRLPAPARGGAAHRHEAEAADPARHDLAVPRAARERVGAAPAVETGQEQEAAVPDA